VTGVGLGQRRDQRSCRHHRDPSETVENISKKELNKKELKHKRISKMMDESKLQYACHIWWSVDRDRDASDFGKSTRLRVSVTLPCQKVQHRTKTVHLVESLALAYSLVQAYI
jgi:hypothetical protein